MAEPYNLLRSKLNRAVVAYLVNEGCGSAENISPANTRTTLGYPNTTVHATMSAPEVQLTGLRRVTVHVSIKGSAVIAKGETNADSSRLAFDARVATTADALLQSDDGQTLRATAAAITAAGRALAVPVDGTDEAAQLAENNADMADFTCQDWFDAGEGDGEADAEGCSWEEVLMFEAICSPSNVD